MNAGYVTGDEQAGRVLYANMAQLPKRMFRPTKVFNFQKIVKTK
jgi:hypothetical protein